MTALAGLGLSAFVFCLVATPFMRDLAVRFGLVDQPDDERKLHKKAVPRIGGIAIVVSYLCALGLMYLCAPSGARVYIQHHALIWALLPGTGIVFMTGLADDLLTLRPWQKLLGQGVASVVAVSLGARLTFHHGPGWVGPVVSVLWLLACTNAVNLIDGMDGLAAGVGLTATVTTLIVALLTGNFGLALATAPLAGCLLAFLRYNFSPASVFLGDCGSLTIGFFLGCLGLIWSHGSGMVGMIGPLMTLALPLIDVTLAISRRFLRNVPIFQADRGHIHHKVLARGFTTRGAALILYGFCCISASLALLQSFGHKELGGAILFLFISVVLIGINRLGYVEFRVARRLLSTRKLRRVMQEQIYLEEMNDALLEARTVEECWAIVQRACDDLQFAAAHMEARGRSFTQQFHTASDHAAYTLQITFGSTGKLQLTGLPGAPPALMMAVLDNVQLAMQKRYSHRRRTPCPSVRWPEVLATMPAAPAPWHVLQISDVLDEEFSAALAESVPVFAWAPERTVLPWIASVATWHDRRAANLIHGTMPLMRGFARFPMSVVYPMGQFVCRQMAAQTPRPAESPLICTAPYFAPAAECWQGPVVYWLTDLIAEYGSSRGIDVPALDRRMCAAADLVCPNSERIAEYLVREAGCDRAKIQVVPNATRAGNLFSFAPRGPQMLPPDVGEVDRPIAGVIGNLAGNMDWLWLSETVSRTPELTWLFVGPTIMPIAEAQQRLARDFVVSLPNTRFVGRKPYGELAAYARAFDVAVLPYLRCEPTFSGSSTRFYEHLAACRPMVATRGFEELTRKEPLLRLVNSPDEAVLALRQLHARGFDDGQTEARWRASLGATWQARAQSMQCALAERLDRQPETAVLARSA